MSRQLIARRYAAALLAAAEELQVDGRELVGSLQAWDAWFAGEDPAARVLRNPAVAPQGRLALLRALLEASEASPLERRFLELCHAKGRLALVGEIAAALAAALDAREGVARGEAAAAHELPASVRDAVADRIGRAIGARRLELAWEVDPDLVGGFRVRVGSRIWDATVRTQLGRLGETIRKGVR